MIRNIIFDFDGTIADDLNLVFEVINSLSKKYHYKKINQKVIEDFRKNGGRSLFENLGIDKIKLPLLVNDIRVGLSRFIENARPQNDIKNILELLDSKNYNLGILTTNSKTNVEKFLQRNGIKVFNYIYHGSGVFGKSVLLKKLLKAQKISAKESLYIGDEDRDIVAARETKIKFIAVSWGFNSKELLKQNNPDYLIDNPSQISKIVEQL